MKVTDRCGSTSTQNEGISNYRHLDQQPSSTRNTQSSLFNNLSTMNSKYESFQVALTVGFLLIGCYGITERAEHGEDCNAVWKCNRRAFLKCNSSGVCDCANPQSMLFDPTSAKRGRCLVKTGEICKLPLGEDESSQTTFKSLPCVRNGNCSAEGHCACNSGFFETIRGTCEPMHSYLEDCDTTKLCDLSLGLLCATNGTCVCDQGAMFEPGEGCLGLPGHACRGTCQKCFHASTSCVDSVCQCSSSEKYWDLKSSGCLAKKGMNSTCESDAECGQDEVSKTSLVCSNGTCSCDSRTSVFGNVFQYASWFDKRKAQKRIEIKNPELMCAPIDGQPCFKGYCSPGTKCEGPFNGGTYEVNGEDVDEAFCQCSPGTIWSQAAEACVTWFGGNCTDGPDCPSGMVCKRSKCSCQFAELKYDSLKKHCVSQVGGPCEADEDCMTSLECRDTVYGTQRECSCPPGFVETAERGCTKIAGMTCSEDSECDPLAELECTNRKCTCRYRAEYSQTERRCRGCVGTPCESNADCIDGADCFRGHKELTAVCRPGYWKRGDLAGHLAVLET